jgi:hypothetical protein
MSFRKRAVVGPNLTEYIQMHGPGDPKNPALVSGFPSGLAAF